VGGHVLRRTRSEGKAVHFDHDIGAFQPEIKEPESGLARTGGAARLAQAGHLRIATRSV